MKKLKFLHIFSIIILVLFGLSALAEAGTAVFRLVVTVPAIAGVNVPELNSADASSPQSPILLVTKQIAMRHGQEVILETAVVR